MLVPESDSSFVVPFYLSLFVQRVCRYRAQVPRPDGEPVSIGTPSGPRNDDGFSCTILFVFGITDMFIDTVHRFLGRGVSCEHWHSLGASE